MISIRTYQLAYSMHYLALPDFAPLSTTATLKSTI